MLNKITLIVFINKSCMKQSSGMFANRLFIRPKFFNNSIKAYVLIFINEEEYFDSVVV